MRQAVYARGVLTDWLVDHLTQSLAAARTSLLVGDGIAPTAGGWTGGQPGSGQFVPYVVLGTVTGARNQRDPLGNDDGSWTQGYTVRAVGSSRQQCDWAGDRSRQVLGVLGRTVLDLDGSWTIQQARYESLGAISRNDSLDPAYWEATDAVSLWLERT